MNFRFSWILFLCAMTVMPLGIQALVYPEANEFIFAEQEPEPLNLTEVKTSIGYPDEARDQGVEGTVVARVLVDSLGKYVKHVIISETDRLLSDAVSEKLPNLTFTPAKAGGKTINFWVNLPFRFKLTGESLAEIENAIDLVTDSLTGDGENYQLWYRRALLHMRKGAWTDAI